MRRRIAVCGDHVALIKQYKNNNRSCIFKDPLSAGVYYEITDIDVEDGTSVKRRARTFLFDRSCDSCPVLSFDY